MGWPLQRAKTQYIVGIDITCAPIHVMPGGGDGVTK